VRIDQVLVGAREGDAITQIALNLRSVLADFGASDVFARHVDPTVAGIVRSIDDLEGVSGPDDVVIFQVSIGDDVVWDTVASLPGRLWVLYQNITPIEFFTGSPEFARHLEQGRRQLVALRPRVEHVLTASMFNRSDLATMGFDAVTLIPGMLEPRRLMGLPSDPAFGREIRSRAPGPIVLFVGQLLPHKRPDVLVSAHHLLRAHHRPDVTLVLAGHHPSPAYAEQVARFAESLGLRDSVWITGGLPDSRLAELYRRADVVVTASQHEGICLPVVEAMAMSIPVVVSDHGALPETVGGCGVVVRDDAPEGYAEAINLVLDPSRRAAIVGPGRERARVLSLEASSVAVHRIIADLLESPA